MIKIATIGTNYIVDSFIDGVSRVDGIEVVGAYSRTEATAKAFAEKHNLQKIYTSLDALAADDAVDAVYVASPNSLHKDQAVMMLKGGKHAYLEKPAATAYDDIIEIENAAKESGKVIMEGMRPVHGPFFEKLCELIGQIGKIRYVSFFGGKYSGRYPAFRNGEILNAFNPALQNSALMDMGVYAVEPIIALFGYPKDIASGGIKLHNGFEGLGSIICTYDGMLASVTYSKISDALVPCEIQGEDGNITIDAIHSPRVMKLYKRGCDTPERYEFLSENNAMAYMISDFCDIINGKTDMNKYFEWTKNTVKLIEEVCRQNGVKFN